MLLSLHKNLKSTKEASLEMAGRGCTISIKLLTVAGDERDEESNHISLPVALHTPLIVLKEQLHSIVGIPPSNQVLILCDLSDSNRNSDILLMGRDEESLRSCGIQGGSILTLHALGMAAELQQSMMKRALASKVSIIQNQHQLNELRTPITASQANHRFYFETFLIIISDGLLC